MDKYLKMKIYNFSEGGNMLLWVTTEVHKKKKVILQRIYIQETGTGIHYTNGTK